MKKLLAVLVNFGTEQINYLKQVVDEIKTFENYNVTIIVHTNVPTGVVGIDEEKIISLENYQFLPRTCKQTVWDNRNDYDIFYWGENDHKILEAHIDNHLRYSEILPDNRISGLIQYEEKDGELWYPAYHRGYDWDYDSAEEHNGLLFAHFTNLHQASFIITREQLLRIGELHDFTEFFGASGYSVKCKVNTDIYQFCGMKKMICISEFEQNLIHHLPNIYIDGESGRRKLGSGNKRMQAAINKLKSNRNGKN